MILKLGSSCIALRPTPFSSGGTKSMNLSPRHWPVRPFIAVFAAFALVSVASAHEDCVDNPYCNDCEYGCHYMYNESCINNTCGMPGDPGYEECAAGCHQLFHECIAYHNCRGGGATTGVKSAKPRRHKISAAMAKKSRSAKR
jgi:hypothetical protein